MKRSDAISVYNMLSAAKLDKLSKESMLATLRNLRALRPVAKEWEETVQEAIKRLSGKSKQEVEGAISEAHGADMKEEIPMELERLTEEGFAELIASIENISGGAVLLLADAVAPISD